MWSREEMQDSHAWMACLNAVAIASLKGGGTVREILDEQGHIGIGVSP